MSSHFHEMYCNLQMYVQSIAEVCTVISLNIFYCQIFIQQWGWVTSFHNLSYDPSPTVISIDCTIICWSIYNFLLEIVQSFAGVCTVICMRLYSHLLEYVQSFAQICTVI